MSVQSCIETCNKLLRGELSAIETYEQALGKFEDPSENAVLTRLKGTHVDHAGKLRQHVVSMGGTPSDDSEAWGEFAKAVEGAAKMLGGSAALRALQAGEQHGINDYRSALDDDDVMVEIKDSIRRELIPQLESNIHTLEELRDS